MKSFGFEFKANQLITFQIPKKLILVIPGDDALIILSANFPSGSLLQRINIII